MSRSTPTTLPLTQPHNYIIYTTLAEKALKYARSSRYSALIADHIPVGPQALMSSSSTSMAYASIYLPQIARLPLSSP